MTFSRVNAAGWTDDVSTVTAAHLNTLDTDHANAVDGLGGGTYTPAAAININGAGTTVSLGAASPATFGGAAGGVLLSEVAGAASNVRLASRSVTRTHPMTTMYAGTWDGSTVVWLQKSNNAIIHIPLRLPHGQVWTSLTARWFGSEDPSVSKMILYAVWRSRDTGAIVGNPSVTDATAWPAYGAAHDVVLSVPGPHTIDNTLYTYYAAVNGDNDGTFLADSTLVSLRTVVTCTGYTEY